ncbi:MAG: MotA/TolQ/ExbB proton channel family protein [Candidatus Omnitrophica bacterium]|nr:MotA/TolQ/ExbB proton channel family protein [Candidatus Omnitrophota bacterium]
MFWDQTLIGLFQKGGFAMWPLFACSVMGLAIIAERALYFLRLRLDYKQFSEELKGLLLKRKIKEALILCRKHPNPVPRIAQLYLKNLKHDHLRSEILKREGSFALEKVETRLRALAAITHIAPLLGLLGTVTGLVAAFHQIEILGGQVQPGNLAAGIWEALITTVFGLVIAIPCMAAYHGFESAADRIARRMQFIISELDEFFGKHSTGDFKTEDIEAADQNMRAIR